MSESQQSIVNSMSLHGDASKCVYAQNHQQNPKRDEYVDAVNSLIAYFNRNSL